MTTIRAKFFVEEIRHIRVPGAEHYAIVMMRPVFMGCRDGRINDAWAKWMTSGQLEMALTSREAIDAFKEGKAYYLDFSPVD